MAHVARTLAVLALASTGCGLGPSDHACVCTSSDISIAMMAVDPSGNPVSGLTPRTTDVATGEDFTPDGAASVPWLGPGYYLVLDDGEVQRVPLSPTMFHFELSGAAGSASTDIMADTDACHCHIMAVGEIVPMLVIH